MDKVFISELDEYKDIVDKAAQLAFDNIDKSYSIAMMRQISPIVSKRFMDSINDRILSIVNEYEKNIDKED